MKAVLNKNLFKVKEGWIVTERKSASHGSLFYQNGNVIEHGTGATMNANCVIATIGFKIEGVPYAELPNEAEEIAEKLSKEVAVYPSAEDDVYQGIVAGYNKAKEKYKYTEEDMRKAIYWAIREGYSSKHFEDSERRSAYWEKAPDKFITDYSKPKQIQEIEFEMEYTVGGQEPTFANSHIIGSHKLKIIPDPNYSAGKVIIKNIKYE